jgi:hypothetical protein
VDDLVGDIPGQDHDLVGRRASSSSGETIGIRVGFEPVQAGATPGLQHVSDTRVDLGMIAQPRNRHPQAATK